MIDLLFNKLSVNPIFEFTAKSTVVLHRFARCRASNVREKIVIVDRNKFVKNHPFRFLLLRCFRTY